MSSPTDIGAAFMFVVLAIAGTFGAAVSVLVYGFTLSLWAVGWGAFFTLVAAVSAYRLYRMGHPRHGT